MRVAKPKKNNPVGISEAAESPKKKPANRLYLRLLSVCPIKYNASPRMSAEAAILWLLNVEDQVNS